MVNFMDLVVEVSGEGVDICMEMVKFVEYMLRFLI